MKCIELFYAIDDIAHMENKGHRYKAMYILWDIAQRLKRDELTASMSQAEVLAGYGVVVEDGKITDWGNTDIDTWTNKLLFEFNRELEMLK